MPSPPTHYNTYYSPVDHPYPQAHYSSHLSAHDIDQAIHSSMHPPQSHIPVDPSLQLYYPGYNAYTHNQPIVLPQSQPHDMNLSTQPTLPAQVAVPSLSPQSSSSQASEYAVTPPGDGGMGSPSISIARPQVMLSNGSQYGSRKRSRLDDNDDDLASPASEFPEGKVKATRGSRACTVCRRLKMKCVGAEAGPPCKRCESGNHQCIFEESNRGKRSANSNAKKHEQLTRSLRKMEKTLDTVLRSIGNPNITSLASEMLSRSPSPDTGDKVQATLITPSPPPTLKSASIASLQQPGSPRLHSLPDNELNPLGMLAEASLANRRLQSQNHSSLTTDSPSDSTEATRKVGVASDLYFKPGPMTILPLRRLFIERQIQPEMLNFVSTDEVVALFKIYFEHMNMHSGILDPEFHTPSLVCSRSPFLLTTICAIASKFYDTRPELHPKLSTLARKLAFSVPEAGYKSIEIVQAYLLLSLWGCGPVERYEQDKTWLLLGMGIRMATDLNLHRKSASTNKDNVDSKTRDMEVHNRERTWLLCYVLDRSMSAQMGKPHSIREDFIIQNVGLFWTKPIATRGDGGLAAYVELQRILSRGLDLLHTSTTSATGLQSNFDYYLVTKTIEEQLSSWLQEWDSKLCSNKDFAPNYHAYWNSMGQFYYNYSVLVVNSFGLQHALDRSPVDIGHFFIRCHTSAVTCATIVRDELGPGGYLRYSPDSHFVQCSYAVLSLLKFTRPVFRSFLTDEKSTFALIQNIADLLENIAAGPLHTPALYSAFLRALISVRVDGSSEQRSPPVNSSTRKQWLSNGVAQPPVTLNELTQNENGNGAEPTLGFLGTGLDDSSALIGYHQFNSEMGPVADMSTFPPTMAAANSQDDASGMLSMDSILSTGFWDSVLVPGYSNSLEGLSGGFVYGAGGSGIITPRLGSPQPSGMTTPTAGRRTEPLLEVNHDAAPQEHSGEGEEKSL